MSHFKEISNIFPLEILIRIFSFLDLIELIELSKIDIYYRQLTKIVYIEKVIKSKLIMEINLGTEQPINIRYECAKFNRNTEQTVWKPTAIIGAKNRRSVNTKEKVILRKIYFENEPHMSEYFNLIHLIKGEMDIKDSGVECIKGEENLLELKKKTKKSRKNKSSINKFSLKNKKNNKEIQNNIIVNSSNNNNNFKESKANNIINTELSSRGSVKSYNSVNSTSSSITEDDNNDYMINNQCLFFYDDNTLIKNIIKWSFEYKVESVSKEAGESWQKLQPSKLRLPIDLFFQNKKEEIPSTKKINYIKYKSIVKKNLLNVLERFSNSFVGVI
ncbi:hypothetical protein BCR32DRAFT_266762 [Anaeromyces robustus]|uniref:F-box domain-containing protein n=1 Tax=Anaeromyces robustus TaxID=1754192 RepID=A0A1Y1XDH6_9FUNG|nr:hypothetical protein BCR32DRAFT_266762 [Anaeromyces robustus]|eukprot:ORX83808.1 hypothetical protein BCR32DRAFT_266762 [Anaeromyces robustus]